MTRTEPSFTKLKKVGIGGTEPKLGFVTAD